MTKQVTIRVDGDLRVLLQDPTSAAAPPKRAGATTLRLCLAATDVLQVAALGLATRTLFAEAESVFDGWQTLGLGAAATTLAAIIRRAQHPGGRPWPEAAKAAALRA